MTDEHAEPLREALEIIAAPPTDAPDAIGITARNIARAALVRDAARQPAEVVEVEGQDGVIHRVWRDAARQPAEPDWSNVPRKSLDPSDMGERLREALEAAIEGLSGAVIIERHRDGSVRRETVLHGGEEHASSFGCRLCSAADALRAALRR